MLLTAKVPAELLAGLICPEARGWTKIIDPEWARTLAVRAREASKCASACRHLARRSGCHTRHLGGARRASWRTVRRGSDCKMANVSSAEADKGHRRFVGRPLTPAI